MSRLPKRTGSWDPENPAFWAATGRRVARRNMWTSVFAEHIGFCVWSLWSVLVLFMTPKNGFTLSTADKFLLTSLVTLVGSPSPRLSSKSIRTPPARPASPTARWHW